MRFWLPDYELAHFREITPEMLRDAGIRGLMVDLDNTIAPWRKELSSEAEEWFACMRGAGIQTCLLSNSRHPTRAQRIADDLGIFCVAWAKKPRRGGYERARKEMKLERREVAIVGDQIFTDILGGKRAGVKTILVTPLPGGELPILRILRFLERVVGRK
ncbi:MAG: YqeG family HAD IIIA-type phosphatase [Peptococcaceae bacterium]|nr:YqeG family HAD IIIA-type phosphatase [Peptococcaceae bacterium]